MSGPTMCPACTRARANDPAWWDAQPAGICTGAATVRHCDRWARGLGDPLTGRPVLIRLDGADPLYGVMIADTNLSPTLEDIARAIDAAASKARALSMTTDGLRVALDEYAERTRTDEEPLMTDPDPTQHNPRPLDAHLMCLTLRAAAVTLRADHDEPAMAADLRALADRLPALLAAEAERDRWRAVVAEASMPFGFYEESGGGRHICPFCDAESQWSDTEPDHTPDCPHVAAKAERDGA